MNLFDLFAKISLDTSDYDRGLDAASGKINTFSSKLGAVATGAAKLVGVGLGAASAAAFKFGKDSIDAGKQFDSAMAQVAATKQKTVEEISDLREFALEMGSTTAFSASQAAEA